MVFDFLSPFWLCSRQLIMWNWRDWDKVWTLAFHEIFIPISLIVHASTSIKDGMLIQNIEDNSWQHPQVLSKQDGWSFHQMSAQLSVILLQCTASSAPLAQILIHSIWKDSQLGTGIPCEHTQLKVLPQRVLLRDQSLWPCCSSGFWTPGLWPLQPEAIIGS